MKANFSNGTRFIASILAVTFLCQDIIWAYPDISRSSRFSQSCDKLAPPKFTQDPTPEVLDRVSAAGIIGELEKYSVGLRIPLSGLSKDIVYTVLSNLRAKFKQEPWFEYEPGPDAIIVRLSSGAVLRIYWDNAGEGDLHIELVDPDERKTVSGPDRPLPADSVINRDIDKWAAAETERLVSIAGFDNIKVPRYTRLNVFPTAYCPVGCELCPFCSSPMPANPKPDMTLSDEGINKTLRFIRDAGGIEELCIEGGGEPMLVLDKTLALIRNADAKRIGVITSGYWASSIGAAEAVLEKLAGALRDRQGSGLRPVEFCLVVSTMPPKFRKVPLENLSNIAGLVRDRKRFGLITRLSVSMVTDSQWNTDECNEVVKAVCGRQNSRDSLYFGRKVFDGGFDIEYIPTQIVYSGRAERHMPDKRTRSDIRYFENHFYNGTGTSGMYGNGYSATVCANGDFVLAEAVPSKFSLGNIYRNNFTEIMQRGESDPIARCLRDENRGMGYILSIVKNLDPEFAQNILKEAYRINEHMFEPFVEICLKDPLLRLFITKYLLVEAHREGRLTLVEIAKLGLLGTGRRHLVKDYQSLKEANRRYRLGGSKGLPFKQIFYGVLRKIIPRALLPVMFLGRYVVFMNPAIMTVLADIIRVPYGAVTVRQAWLILGPMVVTGSLNAFSPDARNITIEANCLIAQRQYDKAVSLLETGERSHPHDYYITHCLMRAHMGAGRYEKALECAGRISPVFERYRFVLTDMARSYLELGRQDPRYFAEAHRCIDRAISLESAGSPEKQPRFVRARLYREEGNRTGELKLYDELLRMDPRDVFAMRSKAHALRHLDRYYESTKLLRRVIGLAGDRADIEMLANWDAVNLARLKKVTIELIDKGRYDEALAELKEAEKLYEDNALVLGSEARVLEKLGRYEEAIAYEDKHLTLDRGNIYATSRKVRCLAFLGRTEEAADLMRGVGQAETTSMMKFISVESKRLTDAGNHKKAAALLLLGQRLEPRNTYILVGMIRVYRNMGEWEKVVAEYKKLAAIEPDRIITLRGMAHALWKAHSCDEAIRMIEKVVRSKESNSEDERVLADWKAHRAQSAGFTTGIARHYQASRVERMRRMGLPDRLIAGILGAREELFYSLLLITGTGLYLTGLAKLAGVNDVEPWRVMGELFGTFFSMIWYGRSHMKGIYRFVRGELFPGEPDARDIFQIMTLGIILRSSYFVISLFLTSINPIIPLVIIASAHGFYNSVIAPRYGLAPGMANDRVKLSSFIYNRGMQGLGLTVGRRMQDLPEALCFLAKTVYDDKASGVMIYPPRSGDGTKVDFYIIDPSDNPLDTSPRMLATYARSLLEEEIARRLKHWRRGIVDSRSSLLSGVYIESRSDGVFIIKDMNAFDKDTQDRLMLQGMVSDEPYEIYFRSFVEILERALQYLYEHGETAVESGLRTISIFPFIREFSSRSIRMNEKSAAALLGGVNDNLARAELFFRLPPFVFKEYLDMSVDPNARNTSTRNRVRRFFEEHGVMDKETGAMLVSRVEFAEEMSAPGRKLNKADADFLLAAINKESRAREDLYNNPEPRYAWLEDLASVIASPDLVQPQSAEPAEPVRENSQSPAFIQDSLKRIPFRIATDISNIEDIDKVLASDEVIRNPRLFTVWLLCRRRYLNRNVIERIPGIPPDKRPRYVLKKGRCYHGSLGAMGSIVSSLKYADDEVRYSFMTVSELVRMHPEASGCRETAEEQILLCGESDSRAVYYEFKDDGVHLSIFWQKDGALSETQRKIDELVARGVPETQNGNGINVNGSRKAPMAPAAATLPETARMEINTDSLIRLADAVIAGDEAQVSHLIAPLKEFTGLSPANVERIFESLAPLLDLKKISPDQPKINLAILCIFERLSVLDGLPQGYYLGPEKDETDKGKTAELCRKLESALNFILRAADIMDYEGGYKDAIRSTGRKLFFGIKNEDVIFYPMAEGTIDVSDHLEDGIRTFLRHLNTEPEYRLLTQAGEAVLAIRRDLGDRDASGQLVKSNLRLTVRIAHDFKGCGLSLMELVQAGINGNMSLRDSTKMMGGLSVSAEQFDRRKGAKFSTYAAYAIKNAMKREINDTAKDVRHNAYSRHKLAVLYAVCRRIGIDDPMKHSAAEIAGELNRAEIKFCRGDTKTDWTEAIVRSHMNAIVRVRSLNERLPEEGSEGDEIGFIFDPESAGAIGIEYVDSGLNNQKKKDEAVAEVRETALKALAHVYRKWCGNDTARLIDYAGKNVLMVKMRYPRLFDEEIREEEGLTLEEISRVFKISRERVRQVTDKGYLKTRNEFQRRRGRLLNDGSGDNSFIPTDEEIADIRKAAPLEKLTRYFAEARKARKALIRAIDKNKLSAENFLDRFKYARAVWGETDEFMQLIAVRALARALNKRHFTELTISDFSRRIPEFNGKSLWGLLMWSKNQSEQHNLPGGLELLNKRLLETEAKLEGKAAGNSCAVGQTPSAAETPPVSQPVSPVVSEESPKPAALPAPVVTPESVPTSPASSIDEAKSHNEGPFRFAPFAYEYTADMKLRHGRRITDKMIRTVFHKYIRPKFIEVNDKLKKEKGASPMQGIRCGVLSRAVLPICGVSGDGHVVVNKNFVRFVIYLKNRGLNNAPPLTDPDTGRSSGLLDSIIYSLVMHELTGHFDMEDIKDGRPSFIPEEEIAQRKRGNAYSLINLKAICYFWFALCENRHAYGLKERIVRFLSANRDYFRIRGEELSARVIENIALDVARLDYKIAKFKIAAVTYKRTHTTSRKVASNLKDGYFYNEALAYMAAPDALRLETAAESLGESPTTDWRHPDIIEKARRIVGAETDALKKSEKIFTWTRNSMDYAFDLNWHTPASEVLRAGYGHCGNIANLTVALLRASGIPARLAIERVDKEWYKDFADNESYEIIGKSGRTSHAWAEAYMDGDWLILDPVQSAVIVRRPPDEEKSKFQVFIPLFDGYQRAHPSSPASIEFRRSLTEQFYYRFFPDWDGSYRSVAEASHISGRDRFGNPAASPARHDLRSQNAGVSSAVRGLDTGKGQMMVKLTGEDDPVKLHDIGAVPRRTTLDLKLKPPASKPLPVKNGALGTGFTLIPLPGNVRLIELHDLMVRERLPAKLKNKEFKIILSESLFDPGDIPALESVLGDGIEIKKPSLVRNDASNVKMPEGAVGCIISKEDYAGYWSESNRANNRSTILVLDVATEDDRALTYIYIEALMSLIYAMRMRDAEKVMRYAKSLFGMDDASAEEELAEFLKDEGAYRPAISKALKLLPIEELDTTRFYSYKDNTSKLLENA